MQIHVVGLCYRAAVGELLSAHTNLEGWPCSVLLLSYSVRQEQHVLLHPVLSLVMLHICSGPALRLKVTEVEDDIMLYTKGCQCSCQTVLKFQDCLNCTAVSVYLLFQP